MAQTTVLQEIIFSNKNPANAILAKVIERKDVNNPQKKLGSFQFKTYNKLLVTANPDSIQGKIDTLYTGTDSKKQIQRIDSADYKFKKYH